SCLFCVQQGFPGSSGGVFCQRMPKSFNQRLVCSWQNAVDLQSGQSGKCRAGPCLPRTAAFRRGFLCEETAMIAFIVNGKHKEVDVGPGAPLLWVLREHLRLTGTK